MDDVAYKLKMDPVEFIAEEHDPEIARRGAVHQLHARRVHPARRRSCSNGRNAGGRSRVPMRDRSSAAPAFAFMAFRSGVGREQRRHRRGRKGVHGVCRGHRCRRPAPKRQWRSSLPRRSDVPLSKVEVVWGDTDRCPYSVGESGSRTTIMTGYAVIQAARALKRRSPKRGCRRATTLLVAFGVANPTLEGKVRGRIRRRISSKWRLMLELGHVRVLKYLAVHDSGRIMNPLDRQQARSKVAPSWAWAWRSMKTCSTTGAPGNR